MSALEAVLYIYIDPIHIELREVYEKHVAAHNHHIDMDPYANSGFDIITPKLHSFQPHSTFSSEFVDFEIKTEMRYDDKPSAFCLYPRSSISKTPLMLANQVGIIDSGYRGIIKGAFRNLDANSEYVVEKHTRLLQICHPSLCRIRVILRDSLTETLRGEGAFGSTGK
jgi:dUTP pyrophosphatase